MSAEPKTAADTGLPPIPDVPVQEGARWRFHRPSSQAVADWFSTVPLDEGLEHKDFVGGIVLIPQMEKTRHTLPSGFTQERQEQVFVPYVQIGTRLFYARRLAEKRGVRYLPKPVDVPKIDDPTSHYYNAHMPPGLWWHVVGDSQGNVVRYLCCTWSVALLDKDGVPLLEGQGTKQVSGVTYNGSPDENSLMKAETGAVGRALGVAGLLTVGTGVATYEDMQDYAAREGAAGPAATPTLPPTELSPGQPPAPTSEEDALTQLRSRYLVLQNRVQELGAWDSYMEWFNQRREPSWTTLDRVPADGVTAMVAKLAQIVSEAETAPEPVA